MVTEGYIVEQMSCTNFIFLYIHCLILWLQHIFTIYQKSELIKALFSNKYEIFYVTKILYGVNKFISVSNSFSQYRIIQISEERRVQLNGLNGVISQKIILS
jgi:hypothetical protein